MYTYTRNVTGGEIGLCLTTRVRPQVPIDRIKQECRNGRDQIGLDICLDPTRDHYSATAIIETLK